MSRRRFNGPSEEKNEADYHVTPQGRVYTSRAEYLTAENKEEPRIIAPERKIITEIDLELEAVMNVIGPEVANFPEPVQLEIARLIKGNFPELMIQQAFSSLIARVSSAEFESPQDPAIQRVREQVSGRLFVLSEDISREINSKKRAASLHRNSLIATAEPLLNQIQRVSNPNVVAISRLPERAQKNVMDFMARIHEILDRTIKGLSSKTLGNQDPSRILKADPSKILENDAQLALSNPQGQQEFLAKSLQFINVFVAARASLVSDSLSNLRAINPQTLGHIVGVLFRAYGYVRSLELLMDSHQQQHTAVYKGINVGQALKGLKNELADLEKQFAVRRLRISSQESENPLFQKRKRELEGHIGKAKGIVTKERLGLK